MGQLAMATRGRPRKTNVHRDSSGKSRGEIVDFSVVFNQPHRRGASDPTSHLLESPLGRMRLTEQVSLSQLRTGNAWAAICRAYGHTMGIPSGLPASGSMAERVASGFYAWEGEAIEIDAEEAERRRYAIKARYNECFETLMELGRVLGRGRSIVIALRKVCIEERYPGEDEIGDIRVGLNALERVLRTGDQK